MNMTNENLAIIPEVRQELVQPERTPADIVERAQEQADVLMKIVNDKKLYTRIGGKDHLHAEAWETIGAFNSVAAKPPNNDAVKPIYEGDEIVAYQAYVELVDIRTGMIRGGASMTCGLDDFPCRSFDGWAKHKAAMSAAQTWTTATALRLNFSWVAVLAGYSPTPHEEMLGKKEETNTTERNLPACDRCGSPTVVRTRKKDGVEFLSCSAWRTGGAGCNGPSIDMKNDFTQMPTINTVRDQSSMTMDEFGQALQQNEWTNQEIIEALQVDQYMRENPGTKLSFAVSSWVNSKPGRTIYQAWDQCKTHITNQRSRAIAPDDFEDHTIDDAAEAWLRESAE